MSDNWRNRPPPVIFIREEGFYPIEIKPGETVEQHVALNPGTIQVQDVQGNILWPVREDGRMDWKPIETAPWGERILVYYDSGEIELMSGYNWEPYAYSLVADIPQYWQPLPAPPDLSPPIGLTQAEDSKDG